MNNQKMKRRMIDTVINRALSKTDNLCEVCGRREKCSGNIANQRTLWCIEFKEVRL